MQTKFRIILNISSNNKKIEREVLYLKNNCKMSLYKERVENGLTRMNHMNSSLKQIGGPNSKNLGG